MYYLLENNKIISGSNKYLSKEWAETIEANFTQEEINKLYNWALYINGVITETPEQLRKEDIALFKALEKEANEKRTEYITAETAPLGIFRDMKLAKLEADRIDLEARYNAIMTDLITKYGEEIMQELL